MERREIDILVISDTHLGTFGSSALELLKYLRSVQPKLIILNGDVIDIWQFNKYYFPEEHTAVLQEIMYFATSGVPTYHTTGNHDDLLRRYTDFSFANIHLVDSLVLEVDGKTAWIFHGDAFDHSVGGIAKTVAQIGGRFYDWSIFFNRQLNKLLRKIGLKPVFISKKMKDYVKSAVKKMNDFEQKGIDLGIEKGYDFVICGHVHRPTIKKHTNENGSTVYLNSGDWLENLTSLEYSEGKWRLYKYKDEDFPDEIEYQKEDMTMAELGEITLNPVVKVIIENGKVTQTTVTKNNAKEATLR
ncbi:MAG: UDP-2,3-diacylglucosamine pyrophosphatase LpxH [Maribacter sp.]|jgi:UDP-2,3-diacylglucosamine pyrophosphatase LpxH